MGGHNTWDPGQSTNQRPLVSQLTNEKPLYVCICILTKAYIWGLVGAWPTSSGQGLLFVVSQPAHTWGGRSWMMGAAETLATCIPALSLSHTRAPPQATFLLLAPDTWVPHSLLNHH